VVRDQRFCGVRRPQEEFVALQGDCACRPAGIDKKNIVALQGDKVKNFWSFRKKVGLQAVKKTANLLLQAVQKCEKSS
jgi:hypothetical protein